jgi:hypothetical protein
MPGAKSAAGCVVGALIIGKSILGKSIFGKSILGKSTLASPSLRFGLHPTAMLSAGGFTLGENKLSYAEAASPPLT